MARQSQAGGLAMATGGAETDDPSGLNTADTTDSEALIENVMPGPMGRAHRISKMSRDQAITRLRGAADILKEQKFDKTSKWLALAQGMLAPTRTGGFGESVGAAAGLIGEEVTKERKFKGDRADRLAEIEMEMGRAEENYADREIDILSEEERSKQTFRGNLKDIYIQDPNDPTKTIRALGAFDQDSGTIKPLHTPDGKIAIRPDDLDPTLRLALARAGELGKTGVQIVNKDIESLKTGKLRLASGYRGLDLLAAIRDEGGTSGFRRLVQKAQEFLGSDAEHVKNRGELMALMGDQLFMALDSFGTQINERELQTAREELAAGGSRATAVNEALLQQLVQKLEAEVMNSSTLVKDFGSDQQIRTARLPMVNYDLSEGMLARGREVGLTFHNYIPFGEEDTVDITARAAGEVGSMGSPHAPESAIEFNDMMRNREKYDIRKGDFINVPGQGIKPVTTD